MSIYDSVAGIYDAINADADYGRWADFIEECFRRYLPAAPSMVLDAACGTGSMTAELARRGYDVTGVDLSGDMLAVAREKLTAAGLDALLLMQDMTALDLYGTYGAAVCCMDAVNHLAAPEELARCLRSVHTFLDPGGLLVFDVNAPYKFENVYGDRTYVFDETDAGGFVVWENDYDAATKLCVFTLNVFTKRKNGLYARSEETQCERCYGDDELNDALRQGGFEPLTAVSGFGFEPLTETDERRYYVARAVK